MTPWWSSKIKLIRVISSVARVRPSIRPRRAIRVGDPKDVLEYAKRNQNYQHSVEGTTQKRIQL